MLKKLAPLYLHDDSHPQARTCALCEVRRGALFGALDAAGLEHIHAHIAAPRVAPDGGIFARGETGGAVYTIRAGIVRFERVTEGGNRRILRMASRGDLIGQEALLGLPYGDDAVACTAVELCRLPLSLVESLGDLKTALWRELMGRWQRALDEAESWATELPAGSARRRVLRLLALLARHADDDGLLWLPRREEIGDMLGITVETASRQISQLRREGVLEPLPGRRARLDDSALHAALHAADL